jgi:hypothetical protein
LFLWATIASKTKKIKEVKAWLGNDEPGKPNTLHKLEMKLETWLAQRSLAQILDWFDCIETTQIKTAMGDYRWSTESVTRDRLFLEYLGVAIK